MIQVAPRRVQLSKDGQTGKLLLKATGSDRACQLAISVAQAQEVSLELNRLASDRCGDHHIPMAVAQAFGARLARLILQETRPGAFIAYLELAGREAGDPSRLSVQADVVAGVSLAIHHGLPIFLEPCPGGVMRSVDQIDAGAATPEDRRVEIPKAFKELIESIHGWTPGEGDEQPRA